MKIAVIGGGVLGMAAAYELLKRGQQVALYERAPVLGGQVRTFDVGGGRLECFYHHLFTSDVDMIDLIHDLGLGDNLTWIPSRVGFFHGG
ncbi:MAG: FAD-dependent oxidoreductase, partial [Chloroflexota bacterium]